MFFHCRSFHLGSRWLFSFSHRRYIIFMFFLPTKKVSVVFFFIISHSSSFPVIHVNLDIQFSSKERLGLFVVVDFLSL